MNLFSRCFSGMAGDYKIGRPKRLWIKVGKETRLGEGLDQGAEMAHQLNFQMIAYKKEAVFRLFLGHGYRQWPWTRESEPKLMSKKNLLSKMFLWCLSQDLWGYYWVLWFRRTMCLGSWQCNPHGKQWRPSLQSPGRLQVHQGPASPLLLVGVFG